jgi:hypothetical protein
MKRYLVGLLLLSIIFGLAACDGGGDVVVMYNLEVGIEGEGTVVPAPGVHKIEKGATVEFEVTPAENYYFDDWGGPDGELVNEENQLLINKNMSVVAIFLPMDTVAAPQFSVTGGIYTGAQQVEISCATEGAEIYYTTDEELQLSASTGTLYTGALNIYQDTTLRAIAVKEGMTDSDITAAEYTINYFLYTAVNPSEGGSVTADPSKYAYKYGETVSLTATPNSGYEFSGWSGDISSTDNPVGITIDDNKNVTAEFSAWPVVSIPQFSISGGTYSGAQQVEISCATEGAEIYYTTDEELQLSASTGTLYTGALNIYQDTTLRAIAVKAGMTDSSVASTDYIINYTLTTTVSPEGTGSITLDPDKEFYKYNESISLTAVANSGYNFSSWSGDLSGSSNPETLIIDDNKSVTAEFAPVEYNFTFTVCDEASNPLNGATVIVGEQTQTTDATGKTTFSLIAGTYSYSVSCGDYDTETGNINVSSENTSKDIVLLYYASTAAELSTALADSTVAIINLDSSEYDLSDSVYIINGSKELKSVSSTTIYLNLEQDISNLSSQDFVTMMNKVKTNLIMSSAISTDLDTIIESGTLDVNSQLLTINGSLFHRAGTFNINGGTVNIGGDYLIEGEDTYSSGYLEMTNPADRVTVNGNFVMDSYSHSGRLTEGILEVKGDFTQKRSSPSTNAPKNFQATLNHKVVFSGINQVISFSNPGSGGSCFANLELASTGTVTLATRLVVTGNMVNNLINEPVNSANLCPVGTATINYGLANQGIWPWDLGIHENWTLQHGVSIGGDYYLTTATLYLGGYGMNIGGTLYQPGGTLNVNGGQLTITENYLIEAIGGGASTGYLEMTNPADRVTVSGNFLMDSYNHSGKLIEGILEVKGDFIQKRSSTSISAPKNFQATLNHKVVFSGINQIISFSNPGAGSSCFANLELASTGTVTFASKAAVTVELINSLVNEPTDSSNLYLAGNAGINGGSWPYDLGAHESWTLPGNISIGGDYYCIGNVTVDINGMEMTIGGSLYHRNGNLNINGGTVDITGDYLIESAEGSYCNGYLTMTNINDYVSVGGNFLTDSTWRHNDKLTAGVLEVKGNFTQRRSATNQDSPRNFQAVGTHKVKLSGNNQTVSFEYPHSTNSCFAELELASSGTVTFASKAAVTVELINSLVSEPTDSSNLYLAGNAGVNGGSWPYDLGAHESWTLPGNISIGGDYYCIGNVTVDINGMEMTIGGSLYHRNGNLNINGGTVKITGDYLIESAEGSYCNGYLTMTNINDYVSVGGNFLTDSTWRHNDKLTAGILEVKGNFTQRRSAINQDSPLNFQAVGSHKVRLSGSSQTISFANPGSGSSCFAALELASSGTVTFATKAPFTGDFINNLTSGLVPINITDLYPAGTATINQGLLNEGEWPWDMGIHENWTLQHDVTVGGDLYIYNGTINEGVYTLTVNGNTIMP